MERNRAQEDYDEIHLYDYVRVIWRRRWLIVIGVIVVTLAALPVSFLVKTYESVGVLRLGERATTAQIPLPGESVGVLRLGERATTAQIPLPDYKTYSATMMDSRAFLGYLKQHHVLDDKELTYMETKLSYEPVLEEYITPIYAYSKKDSEAMKATLNPKEQFLSAVKLSWKGSTPECAQKVVTGMGLFVRKVLEQKVMETYVNQGYRDSFSAVQAGENKLADLRFSLEQIEKKLGDLKKIAHQFPQVDRAADRQVVSVEQGGHLYLPPSLQLMATQVRRTDTTLGNAETERNLAINRINLELFTKMKKALDSGDPEGLFERLTQIKDGFFEGKDKNTDEIVMVRNAVAADFALFEYWFRDVITFISGPILPDRSTPAKRVVVGIAFVASLFLFISLAFFLEFLRQGRERERIEMGGKAEK